MDETFYVGHSEKNVCLGNVVEMVSEGAGKVNCSTLRCRGIESFTDGGFRKHSKCPSLGMSVCPRL